MAGYAYAASNPATNSDPTGLTCTRDQNGNPVANCYRPAPGTGGSTCAVKPSICAPDDTGGTGTANAGGEHRTGPSASKGSSLPVIWWLFKTVTTDAEAIWQIHQRGIQLPRCTPDNQLACTLNPLIGVLIAGDDGGQDPLIGELGGPAAEDFTAPETYLNRHGQLTNGTYTLDEAGMAPHMTGSTISGKSQFLFGVNADQAVLDAAAHADSEGLWVGNKAKVFIQNGPIGILGDSGELTDWLNIYRTRTGFVHGAPGGAP
jgi:hypothetical protein